ncbi:hypothetical protein K505DRAFT_403623 [Melanomma pulvis-pyrius CBS 109.77]|uniref:CENP-V/GFA domain-containing protein n=1 Tax=Melanomma pulvis-pyrius CBS 109.77 TaxID=1314802 RepID=A0A6A6XXQ0_9PLEO|nr:hypothetical protein K505DRAFT_403623 [Melanomma pulvis-pyrius CBS 109.77]
MAQTGSCMCGAIRYEVEGEPAMKALCHCSDCRKISGSTYSTNAVYPATAFKLVSGTPKLHTKIADSGKNFESHFCGDCGSTLWREGGAFPGLVVVKIGTLDDLTALDDLKPGAELFVPRRVPWVTAIEGAQQAQGMS